MAASQSSRNDMNHPNEFAGASRGASTYDAIAGRSLERLAALSDGVFAVAMTLLVLDLRVPAASSIHSSKELWFALGASAPSILTYLMSFLTLGIFWLAQQAQLHHCRHSDKRLTWIHIAYLLIVTLLPFSTALLSRFMAYQASVLCYWLNLMLLGAVLFASIRYAKKAHLVSEDTSESPASIHERRILIFQMIYFIGALASFISTYCSIVIFLGAQLVSVLSPGAKPHTRGGIVP
jgi:uncharacterized membrane protein